jgi:hypothetical protein
MEVITLMKEGGQSNGVVAAVFEDCYHLALDFPKVLFDIPLERLIVLLMS